jgi:hypothetical protein
VLAVPLVWLLISAPARPALYYIQVALPLFWLLAELILDYILELDFRKNRATVICYVVLFFAAGGGLIGVAAPAGVLWTIISVVLFLAMAALAFIQRIKTGE